eukprot:1091683-Pelagomonas_calceolata.AAC.3
MNATAEDLSAKGVAAARHKWAPRVYRGEEQPRTGGGVAARHTVARHLLSEWVMCHSFAGLIMYTSNAIGPLDRAFAWSCLLTPLAVLLVMRVQAGSRTSLLLLGPLAVLLLGLSYSPLGRAYGHACAGWIVYISNACGPLGRAFAWSCLFTPWPCFRSCVCRLDRVYPLVMLSDVSKAVAEAAQSQLEFMSDSVGKVGMGLGDGVGAFIKK